MHRPFVAIATTMLTLTTAGCLVEAPPPRFWVENNADITIVVRRPTKFGDIGEREVPAHQKIEVQGHVSSNGCTPTWEIVDTNNKQLRAIDKICDGDTVVYP